MMNFGIQTTNTDSLSRYVTKTYICLALIDIYLLQNISLILLAIVYKYFIRRFRGAEFYLTLFLYQIQTSTTKKKKKKKKEKKKKTYEDNGL